MSSISIFAHQESRCRAMVVILFTLTVGIFMLADWRHELALAKKAR